MKNCLIQHIQNEIMKRARIQYEVLDLAPNIESDLFQNRLIIWSGASENTVYGEASVNWSFRALHDALHLKTGLRFTHADEIELGRIQASQFEGIMADIIYCEIAGQAKYHLETGLFVSDQVLFTENFLKSAKVL